MHNRFYIPLEAEFVQFDYNFREIEFGLVNDQPVPRQPDVSVFVRVGNETHPIGTLTPAIPSSPTGESDFLVSSEMSLVIRQDPQDPTSPVVKDLRGEVGELIFRLSFPETEPHRASGQTTFTRVWIDNVRLGPAGAPLEAESAAHTANAAQMLTAEALTPLIDASRTGWRGVVEVPDGITGVALGNVGVTTPNLSLEQSATDETGDTRVRERGLDDQLLFTDFDLTTLIPVSINQDTGNPRIGSLRSGLSHGGSVADKIGIDNNTPLSTNGHAVQSQNNSRLLPGQHTVLEHVIVNDHAASQSIIGDGGAAINELAIELTTDFDIGGDLTSPSSNGAVTGLEVLKLEELALQPFQTLPGFAGELGGLIESHLLFDSAGNLRHGESQSDHSTVVHEPSQRRYTDTVSSQFASIKESGFLEEGLVDLTPGQLDLLKQATVVISDLSGDKGLH